MKREDQFPGTAVICNRKSGPEENSAADSEAEYDSPETIEAIRSVLERRGVPAVTIEADEHLAENLKAQRIRFAFNLAEGKGGRDREAQVPGVLGLLGIPYMGSDATAMGVSLDKNMCKRLAASYGVRVPKGAVLNSLEDVPEKLRDLAYPIILKPNAEGSGRGIFDRSIAKDEEELKTLLAACFSVYDGSMLAEEYLPGREFTVGLLGNGPEVHAFRPMEICYHEATEDSFYVYSYRIKKDFRKYVHYECPAKLPPDTEQEMMDAARTVFLALGCHDVSRVDFRLDASGRPCFLELNPLPGLAPDYSDYPFAAESEGYTYDDIIFAIYETALKRCGLQPEISLPEGPCLRKTEQWAAENPEWNDWHWQMRNRVRNAEELAKWLPVSPKEREEIDACLSRFRMAVTPYYLSLINPLDPQDPVRLQCIPSGLELRRDVNDREDPLNENGDSPVPFITHRYPDRVLFLVTLECAEYCRHCTRRRIVGEEDHAIRGEALDRAIAYIRSHEEIRDVLISGGDPLTLPTARLEEIIRRLREIPHVDIIRIGTRVPVCLPMRIDDELLSMLKKYQPIWINTHFNHVNELTPESEAACGRIVDAGIPLGNQSVLLRGINDTPEKMKALLLRLVHARVRPYYLYQCDLSSGISHFRTPVETGIQIMHTLQGNISGFAIPKFVIDAPGGGGKVPISYPYIISHDAHEIVFENYQGKIYRYPEPEKGE